MEMIDSKELSEVQAHIWSHTFNYMVTMALRCTIQLGIPDIISDHDRPITLSELVAQLSIPQTKANQLNRLMQLLVHTGVFAIQKDDQGQEGYVLTNSSKLFSRKIQGNVVPFILLLTDPIHVTPCLTIAEWFRGTDSTPFETVHGKTIYDYYERHLEAGNKFNDAMASYSELKMKAMLKDLKPMLEGFESLVDVGGGTGSVAKAISEAVPHLKYTIYDLPHVISDIKDLNNITLVAGDMFQFVPSADVILIKDVLIDWSDEECLKILKQCREAISKVNNGGKLIIVTRGPNPDEEGMESIQAHLCFDAFMMTCVTGKERTETEWKKIFQDAGFTNYKITTLGWSSIIEVFP